MVFVGDNGTGEQGAAAATADGRSIFGRKGTKGKDDNRIATL